MSKTVLFGQRVVLLSAAGRFGLRREITARSERAGRFSAFMGEIRPKKRKNTRATRSQSARGVPAPIIFLSRSARLHAAACSAQNEDRPLVFAEERVR